jgi:heme A synthase
MPFTKIGFGASFSLLSILALGSLQIGSGVANVVHSSPIDAATRHQIGALLIVAATLFALHTTKKPNKAHIEHIFNSLKNKDQDKYEKLYKMYYKRSP